MIIPLELLLRIGGGLHFCILTASALVPFVLDWKATLASLPKLVRQLMWVYGAYVVLMIISLGAVCLALPYELSSGTPLARAVCGFGAVFWGVRLGLQFFYFDAREYLTTRWLRFGHGLLTVAFALLTLVFAMVALS